MIEDKKEKEFRSKVLKILKAYQKVKGAKWNAQKILDQISSEELHKRAEIMLKTQTEYEKMKGGKKTRKKRKRRKNRTRRVQRGGQWEYFLNPFIIIAIAGMYIAQFGIGPIPPLFDNSQEAAIRAQWAQENIEEAKLTDRYSTQTRRASYRNTPN